MHFSWRTKESAIETELFFAPRRDVCKIGQNMEMFGGIFVTNIIRKCLKIILLFPLLDKYFPQWAFSFFSIPCCFSGAIFSSLLNRVPPSIFPRGEISGKSTASCGISRLFFYEFFRGRLGLSLVGINCSKICFLECVQVLAVPLCSARFFGLFGLLQNILQLFHFFRARVSLTGNFLDSSVHEYFLISGVRIR